MKLGRNGVLVSRIRPISATENKGVIDMLRNEDPKALEGYKKPWVKELRFLGLDNSEVGMTMKIEYKLIEKVK